MYDILFLAGERSPHDNPRSRGVIYGLSLNHERKHFARALMEGIAYRISSIYDMLTEGRDMEIVMSGGILRSPVWLKNLADFLGRKLLIPTVHETYREVRERYDALYEKIYGE